MKQPAVSFVMQPAAWVLCKGGWTSESNPSQVLSSANPPIDSIVWEQMEDKKKFEQTFFLWSNRGQFYPGLIYSSSSA